MGIFMPLDIVEEILLNLPVKSLVRFSAVSRAWTTMISDARFIRRYRTRTALSGRERIPIRGGWERIPIRRPESSIVLPTSTLLLSSLSSYARFIAALPVRERNPLGALPSIRLLTPTITLKIIPIIKLPLSSNYLQSIATPLFCPLKNEQMVRILASCSDMWFLKNENSLFLWNPSMGTYSKLKHPSIYFLSSFRFGMGYDSLADDYKILMITNDIGSTMLYSLRSNSWRKFQPLPLKHNHKIHHNGVFVSGALHWMPCSSSDIDDHVIISLDLSTEKYAEVATPPPFQLRMFDTVDLTVLREKLCIYMKYHLFNNRMDCRMVLWEMQEYGEGKSWTKMFNIDVSKLYISLTPFYIYDNGMILIKVRSITRDKISIFMYRDGQSKPQNVFDSKDCSVAPLYIESLVSPATYCGSDSHRGHGRSRVYKDIVGNQWDACDSWEIHGIWT